MFNKKEFAKLLLAAKGDKRSMRSYAMESDISPSHLSRLSREMVESPPTPETLKKLSVHAFNGVTLNMFMKSCGYLEEPKAIKEEKRGEVAKLLFETQNDWSVRSGSRSDYELIDKDGKIWEWIEGGPPKEIYGKLAMEPHENKRSIVVRSKMDMETFLSCPPQSLVGDYSLILISKNSWKEYPLSKKE